MRWLFFFATLSLSTSVFAEENACITCHDLLDDEAATKWSQNIHAKSGMHCVDCHGGDPSQNDFELAKTKEAGFVGIPMPRTIPTLCGSCHAKEAKLFLESPMAEPLMTNRYMACVSCHTGHRIETLIQGKVGPTCKTCHSNGEPGLVFAKTYEASFSNIQKKKKALETAMTVHKARGMDTESIEHELEFVNNALNQARVTLHSFDFVPVHAHLSKGLQFLKKAEKANEHLRQKYEKRRSGLIFSSILLLMLTILLGWKIRTLPTKENHHE